MVSRRQLLQSIGVVGLSAGIGMSNSMSSFAAALPLYQRAKFGLSGAIWDNTKYPNFWDLQSSKLRTDVKGAGMFYSFDTTWTNHQAKFDALNGKPLNICWEPKAWKTVFLKDIPLGLWDPHIDQMLAGFKAYSGELVVRWGHEMNGNWYPWSMAYTGANKGITSQAEYKAAFQYIVNRCRAGGDTKTQFAFCINGDDVGGYSAASYYPGASMVQVMALDSYNTYDSNWKSPFTTINPGYTKCANLNPTAPIEIHEIGCVEPTSAQALNGASKKLWAIQLGELTDFPRLRRVNYFASVGGRNWQVDTTPDTLLGFRQTYQNAAQYS